MNAAIRKISQAFTGQRDESPTEPATVEAAADTPPVADRVAAKRAQIAELDAQRARVIAAAQVARQKNEAVNSKRAARDAVAAGQLSAGAVDQQALGKANAELSAAEAEAAELAGVAEAEAVLLRELDAQRVVLADELRDIEREQVRADAISREQQLTAEVYEAVRVMEADERRAHASRCRALGILQAREELVAKWAKEYPNDHTWRQIGFPHGAQVDRVIDFPVVVGQDQFRSDILKRDRLPGRDLVEAARHAALDPNKGA